MWKGRGWSPAGCLKAGRDEAMKKDFTGWTKIGGCDVYVENGLAKRAVRKESNGGKVRAGIYKRDGAKTWNGCGDVKINTLRSGVSRGTYIIQ